MNKPRIYRTWNARRGHFCWDRVPIRPAWGIINSTDVALNNAAARFCAQMNVRQILKENPSD